MRSPRIPRYAELQYQAAIMGMLRPIIEAYRTEVIPFAGSAAADSGERKDAIDPGLRKRLRAVKGKIDRVFSDSAIGKTTFRLGKIVNEHSKKETVRLLTLNARVVPELAGKVDAFRRENINLIKDIPNKLRSRIEDLIDEADGAGMRAETLAQRLEDELGISERRAALIAKDQVLKLNADLNSARQQALGITSYVWSTSNDERVRESHRELDGKTFDWDDPPTVDGQQVHPGEDYQCVPGDSMVLLNSPAKIAWRHWHTKELTSFVSDSLEHLDVTSNHPVLTDRGWLPAHRIKVGDYLIHASSKLIDGTIDNPGRRISTAAEIFGAAQAVGVSHRIPGRAAWFHGDGAAENVDVVSIDMGLLFGAVSAIAKNRGEDFLSWSAPSALRLGHFPHRLVAWCLAAHRIMSGLRPGQALRFCRALHALKHGSASAASAYSILSEYARHCEPALAEPQGLSDCQLADAALIHANDLVFRKIKAIMRRPFCGWVYNFETAQGWYLAQGIAVHNCRCVATPVIPELDK